MGKYSSNSSDWSLTAVLCRRFNQNESVQEELQSNIYIF
jgi:hypothetical protein